MDDEPGGPHVCFLTSSAPLGPDDPYSPFILDLARRLNRGGFRVTILMPHVAGSATDEVLEGVRFRRFRYLPFPGSETLGAGGGMLPGLRDRPLDLLKVPLLLRGQLRALARLHRSDPVRLLHSHWLIPQGVVGGRFARSRGIPHLATAHGSDLLGLRFPGADAALRYAVRRSDLVTVNSGAMLRVLRERAGASGARVVPTGARVPPPDAVRGALELRRELPGQGGVLTFVGPVAPERVPVHMSAMDVLVVPSHHEAQGLVAVEAMLLGVPVAAFATGGLREVVVDGETGVAVEEGRIEALAEGVERLLDDPRLRERLVRRARSRALERFTLDAAADRFGRLYRELVGP